MNGTNPLRYLTGSDLLTGQVVFRAADGTWVDDLARAEMITDPELGATRLDEAELLKNQIVGPYLAEAKAATSGPVPAHFRERFRATGPSNYPHGKQERQRHV